MKHTLGPRVDLNDAAWRRSSYSGDQGNCAEVADGFPGLVPVRDSKNASGPALVFGTAVWAAFVAGVKSGAGRR